MSLQVPAHIVEQLEDENAQLRAKIARVKLELKQIESGLLEKRRLAAEEQNAWIVRVCEAQRTVVARVRKAMREPKPADDNPSMMDDGTDLRDFGDR